MPTSSEVVPAGVVRAVAGRVGPDGLDADRGGRARVVGAGAESCGGATGATGPGAGAAPAGAGATGAGAALARMAALCGRELRVEAAGRELARVVPAFVLCAVILAGLGFGPRPDVLATVAPALSWLVVLFATVPLARSVAAVERDEGCWDMLRGLCSPAELVGAKTAAVVVWLGVSWSGAAVVVAGVCDAPLRPAALVAGALGVVGLGALVTSFGVVLGGAGAGAGMLSVLVAPVALPVLVGGAQAGTPGVDAVPWIVMLVAYDVIGLAVAWAISPVLVEE